jgi:hypothetical protein
MLPTLEHHPVNWVDGMKISRRHFSDFEHFVSDHLRDANAVGRSSTNYGLLASSAPDFSLQVVTDQNQNMRLLLTNCRAVTGAGCRIDLVNSQLELATNLTEILAKFNLPMANELEFLIVLSVDLFSRKPAGAPADNEPFPRPPFTLPTYWLSVVPRHQYNLQTGIGTTPESARPAYRSADFESYHLVVGQMVAKYGQLQNDELYIPASTTVSAHTRLLEWAASLNKLITEVQRDSFQIVNKVCEKRGSDYARKAGVLAELIRDLGEQLAAHTDETLNQLRFTSRQRPPIELLEAITLATRRFRTSLNCLNNPGLMGSVKLGRDIVLDYFNKWTDITPTLLLRDLDTVIHYNYDHANIRPQLVAITQCWEKIYTIVHKMTELEYIGQEPQQKGVLDQSRPTDERDLPRENTIIQVPKAARPSFLGGD